MNSFLHLWSTILWPAVLDTLFMTIVALLISVVLGFIISLVLVVTGTNGLKPNGLVYDTLNVIINLLRSLPFIILAVAITPLTRTIAGSSIGRIAAIVPLVFTATPFIAKLYENSMNEVNPSLVEAARSFGASTGQILRGVIVKESVPALTNDTTLSTISLLGATAMAGAIGAGGLGAVALTYGYQSFNNTIMYTTVIILIVLAILIQTVGQFLYFKFR